MRRVLFLDFDGVLNSQSFLLSAFQASQKRGGGFNASIVDPQCVSLLNSIVTSTGCEIVISSAWREAHTLGEIMRILKRAGFLHNDKIVDITPSMPSGDRGKEIMNWIDNKGVGAYEIVILDDNADMGPLLFRLVQTDPTTGLSSSDVERVKKMFEQQSEE